MDLGDFVRRLDPAVREAAAIARRLEGRVANRPKLDEISEAKQALTEADTAAQEAILETLLVHYPDVSLEAEEDTATVDRFPTVSDSVVVIDPIDGTLHSYLNGRGPYAVIVGLARGGVLDSSLVALPREGLIFAASKDRGAGMATPLGPFRPVGPADRCNRILVSPSMPERVSACLEKEGFDPVLASGGAIAVAPLIPGVRAGIRYSQNELGISIRGRVGALISAEAGACIRTGSGEPFPLDLVTPSPILCVTGAPEDQDVLQAALAEIPTPH